MPSISRRALLSAAGAGAASLALTGCMAGEGSGTGVANSDSTGRIRLDYATYNPLSLIIRKRGWLERAAEPKEQSVEWVRSTGSNTANQALRAAAIDIGSTAGSAALLARANGSPIRVIDLCSQPEWAALVRRPDSPLREVADLRGASVAVTKGTDPYFLLLQALGEAGLSASDVTVQNLQHADGRTALDTGQVDAWSGLDPIMATAEEDGDVLFYRNLSFNTYGFLNAREEFLQQNGAGAQLVVDVYAYARRWALENPEEAVGLFAEEAGISLPVARSVWDRTHLDIDHVPGAEQVGVLEGVGPILVDSGDVPSQEDVDAALERIVEKKYAEAADPDAVAAAIEGD
ncbi:aliphatic sulfonate ABC transporter substrate-binding protein [Rothia sp. AR01]|uniref:Putative aliphatic sulfonates-binding protein n=1 Tax=Rothia santali TaxID=2949643 RepID=A0A9X2HKS4_9MICC|nr:aliphatic sulfonate ABC transporter substrate-binding protein [Rothia santali]MCP3426738.1 aliphatic sulfonate ABC transporter substrate-binding protein [Rothia santali]